MTSSKQVNIRKSLRQSLTNIPCDYSGQTTNLGVFSAYLYTPESCDGLQRHEHVMLPQGVLITAETPMCLNEFRSIIRIGSTLSHSRIHKTCPGYSCSCPRRTPCNDYVIRYVTTTKWHACSVGSAAVAISGTSSIASSSDKLSSCAA